MQFPVSRDGKLCATISSHVHKKIRRMAAIMRNIKIQQVPVIARLNFGNKALMDKRDLRGKLHELALHKCMRLPQHSYSEARHEIQFLCNAKVLHRDKNRPRDDRRKTTS